MPTMTEKHQIPELDAPLLGAAVKGDRPRVDRRAEYAPRSHWDAYIVPLLKREITQYLETLEIQPKNVMLDVGCGEQPFRRDLERIGFIYKSLDVKQNSQNNVDYIGEIDSPTLSPALVEHGPYSFVMCTEVLEHVAGWDRAFQNLSKLVKPHGQVLLTCPFIFGLHEEPYDFWRPTVHALRHYAQKNGFRVTTLKAAGNGWEVFGTVLGFLVPTAKSKSLVDRVTAKTLRIFRRGVLLLLSKQLFGRQVELAGPMYLSNIVVLERE
jgi:SAM-dependent methyltransferase